jgi:hypothetical protein
MGVLRKLLSTMMLQPPGCLQSYAGRRAIAGMATMASRKATFPLAFLSIIDQVDRLYLYLDGHEVVPELVRDDPRVVSIFAHEQPSLGSNGKLLGLLYELEPCLYVSVDDDIAYSPNYVSHLARERLACRGWRTRFAADVAVRKLSA